MNIKQKLKNIATTGIHYSGIDYLYMKKNSRDVLRILNYHNIEERDDFLRCDYLSVEPEVFKDQLKSLKERGFNFIPYSDFEKWAEGEGEIPPKAVMLTFDDGHKSLICDALPILKELQIPFVLFLTTGGIQDGDKYFWWEKLDYCISGLSGKFKMNITGKGFEEDIIDEGARIKLFRGIVNIIRELPKDERLNIIDEISEHTGYDYKRMKRTVLTFEEVQELQKSGLCTIQGHTVTHRSLNTCSREELLWELKESKDYIEKNFNTHVNSFSFPGGVVTKEANDISRELGYRYIFTTSNSINKGGDIDRDKGVLIFDRTSIGTHDYRGTFLSKITGTYSFIKRK